MQAKINAALKAVEPVSSCCACAVANGANLNSICAMFGPSYDPKKFGDRGGTKGTLYIQKNLNC